MAIATTPLGWVRFAQGWFAIATVSLGALILTYRDFAPIWHSIPEGIPARAIMVDGSGLVVLAAGAGLCFSRTSLPSALTIGIYHGLCAAVRVPAVLSEPLSVGSWYGFCEALAPLLGAWILYLLLQWHASPSSQARPRASQRAMRTARVLFGLSCIVFGLAHFAYADFTASLVPAWLPGRLGVAYLTGLGHVAAGIGIGVGIFSRLAATLEAVMMSAFGLLVWVPSLFTQPPPAWAGTSQNQWSELVVTLLLAAAAWVAAAALQNRPVG